MIAIPSGDGFWSPNGRHRLAAAKQLGLRSITALLTDDPALAYRILALNTEKAHNLRDRALEVIRMARQLAKEAPRSKESEHATSFESPAFLTLGAAYEKRDRFAGSSYNSMLRRVDRFMDTTLPAALRQREQWAVRLMDIDPTTDWMYDLQSVSLPSSHRARATEVPGASGRCYAHPTRDALGSTCWPGGSEGRNFGQVASDVHLVACNCLILLPRVDDDTSCDSPLSPHVVAGPCRRW